MMKEIQSDIPKQISNHMGGELIFKTKFSFLFLLYTLAAVFFVMQLNCFIHKDFFNKTVWLDYGMFLIGVNIFSLFFTSSIEIYSDYFKVKFPSILFFLKPKIYMIDNIDFVKIVHVRGRGIMPYISFKLKDKEMIINHYYWFISEKSIKEMFLILKNLNVNVSFRDKPL